jgi:hypothetical protein
MAAKIGIEEYLMEKFKKFIKNLITKFQGEKLCQKKVNLLNGHI